MPLLPMIFSMFLPWPLCSDLLLKRNHSGTIAAAASRFGILAVRLFKKVMNTFVPFLPDR